MQTFGFRTGAVAAAMPAGEALSALDDLAGGLVLADVFFALCCLAVSLYALWGGRRDLDFFPSQRTALAIALGAGTAGGLLVVRAIASAAGWPLLHGFLGYLVPAVAIAFTGWVAAVNLRASRREDGAGAPPAAAAVAAAARHDAWPRDIDRPERAKEAATRAAFLETATANAQISVFAQDRDLRYTWSHNPRIVPTPERLVGRTDAEVHAPGPARDTIVQAKRRVLDTGVAETYEVELPEGDSHSWFRVTTAPLRDDADAVVGLVSSAVDITRPKRLETMRRDLNARLSETLQRLTLAMRASGVVVFSQDRDLRCTWVSDTANPAAPKVGTVEGGADAGEATRRAVALKRRVMDTGQGDGEELRFEAGGQTHWFELTVEPTRDDADADAIVGVTCALSDVTERKKHEEQMRVVMLELSHRSKNLMAVIQAVARQTARNAPDLDGFADTFAQRLRAISAAQDVLVDADWGRTALDRLLAQLLVPYRPRRERIAVAGPPVALSASATQTLALAFHELLTNAIKYGALSNAEGRIDISWERAPGALDGEDAIALRWRESGGPPVRAPDRRGFGTVLVEDNVASVLSARVALDYRADGLIARFDIPERALAGG